MEGGTEMKVVITDRFGGLIESMHGIAALPRKEEHIYLQQQMFVVTHVVHSFEPQQFDRSTSHEHEVQLVVEPLEE